jgi:hypothetical protein
MYLDLTKVSCRPVQGGARQPLAQWITIPSTMFTIAELPEYIRRADKLMSIAERLDIVNYLAAHPKAGDLIEGTGGVRKLR